MLTVKVKIVKRLSDVLQLLHKELKTTSGIIKNRYNMNER